LQKFPFVFAMGKGRGRRLDGVRRGG